MKGENRVKEKLEYKPAEIKTVLFDYSDVIATSCLGWGDNESTSDGTAWT